MVGIGEECPRFCTITLNQLILDLVETGTSTRRSKNRFRPAKYSFLVVMASLALEILTYIPRADPCQLKVAWLDPGEEFPDRVYVILLGVGVGSLGL